MELGVERAYKLLTEKLSGWLSSAIEMLPNFVAAVLILIAFYLIGWVARRVINRTLTRVTTNRAVIGLIETTVGAIIVTTGVFIALGILKLDGTVTSLLAGVGVIGLALGFAFQDIAANFMSGVILSIQHPYGIEDVIKCKDYYGYVHDINLRSTVIRTMQGQLVHVPNKEILNTPLINYSWDKKRRVDVSLGVSYSDDHEKVLEVAVEAIRALDACNQEMPVDIYYTEIGGSTFNCTLRFWVDFQVQSDFLKPQSDAIIAVSKAFNEHDIDMPYPITTLEFGPKGGVQLDAMLRAAESKPAAQSSNAPSENAQSPSGQSSPQPASSVEGD